MHALPLSLALLLADPRLQVHPMRTAARVVAPAVVLAVAFVAPPAAAQIHVDADATGAGTGQSWADAYTDLVEALEAAPDGATVWVAEGVYRPSTTGDTDATFLVPVQVGLYGGFDGTETSLDERAGLFDTTILSGDLLGDDGPGFTNTSDNSRHVVTFEYLVATLDGFTIEGGNAVGSDGGGLYGPLLGATLLQNCTFRANQASRRGGAVYIAPGDILLARHCTFEDNRAGEEGGAFWTSSIDAQSTFENCRFVGNRAGVSGGGLGGWWMHLVGCEFVGNSADGGEGGGAIRANEVWLINSTLWRNTARGASAGGGGLLTNSADIRNCILWGNVDGDGMGEEAQIRLEAPSPLLITESNAVQGWTGLLDDGPGHVLDDPRFADPLGADGVAGTADDDLRLGTGSPCLDTGADVVVLELPATDIDGLPRLVDAILQDLGGVVDIGAHERRPGDGTTASCAQPPTSLGVPAVLVAPGVASLSAGPLVLEAAPVPSFSGTFAFGAELAPAGAGRCVDGPPLHLLPATAVAGSLTLSLDAAALAALGVLPGTTWHAQVLFDDGGQQHASNAVTITLLE